MPYYSDRQRSFTEEDECRCPTKFFKAYLMEHVTVPSNSVFYNHHAVVIYFQCLECDSEFSYTFDLTDQGSRQRCGYYANIYEMKKSAELLWLARDEIKSVFDQFIFGPEKHSYISYNCSHYANQFYNAIYVLNEESCI